MWSIMKNSNTPEDALPKLRGTYRSRPLVDEIESLRSTQRFEWSYFWKRRFCICASNCSPLLFFYKDRKTVSWLLIHLLIYKYSQRRGRRYTGEWALRQKMSDYFVPGERHNGIRTGYCWPLLVQGWSNVYELVMRTWTSGVVWIVDLLLKSQKKQKRIWATMQWRMVCPAQLEF